MLKAVILMGGPQKGTRFRPLSLDIPKPLFPVAGRAMVEHLIRFCLQVKNLREILLIGGYQQDDSLSHFISRINREHRGAQIRYLQEYAALGTAGGVLLYRDIIRRGSPEGFFVINGDICGELDLNGMLQFHRQLPADNMLTVMATSATKPQSLNFGCIVEDQNTREVLHYVEKPETFVSQLINCGVYLCSADIFGHLQQAYSQKSVKASYERTTSFTGDEEPERGQPDCSQEPADDCLYFEDDVLAKLAGSGRLHVFNTERLWSQIKTAGSAIYANRKYLELIRETEPTLLASNGQNRPKIIGDVIIEPSAIVDPSATLGPNVSIGKGVKVGAGVRIKESIVLRDATISDHSLIMHSIVGWNNYIGAWSRVEGTPCDPNPNSPFARSEQINLFNGDGKLNPSITVLGSNVQVPSEVIVLNSIVLPHKELSRSYKNEIIL